MTADKDIPSVEGTGGQWQTLAADPPQEHMDRMFSDLNTLGGLWNSAGDETLEWSLNPSEGKAAAANLHWLAYQEDTSLEDMAPVADIYREQYNQRWFNGEAKTDEQFYQAVSEQTQQQKRVVGFWESLLRGSIYHLGAIPEYIDRALIGFAVLGDGLDPIPQSAYAEKQEQWWQRNVIDRTVAERRSLAMQPNETQGMAGQAGWAVSALPRDLALTAGTVAALPELAVTASAGTAENYAQSLWQTIWPRLVRGGVSYTAPAALNGMDAATQAANEGKDLRIQTARAVAETALSMASAALPMGATSAAKTPAIRFLQRAGSAYVTAVPSSTLLQQAQAMIEGDPALSPDMKKVAVDSLVVAAVAAILGSRGTQRNQPGRINVEDENARPFEILRPDIKRSVPTDKKSSESGMSGSEVNARQGKPPRKIDSLVARKFPQSQEEKSWLRDFIEGELKKPAGAPNVEVLSKLHRPERFPRDIYKTYDPTRQQYIDEVENLWFVAVSLLERGSDVEQVARAVSAMRKEIKSRYRMKTPETVLSIARQRDAKKYENTEGPTIDFLRGHGKTWEQIIESSCKPGGRDLEYLYVR